jgi:hypothetical protein
MDIWQDEIYTALRMGKSFQYLIRHIEGFPPFYYLTLKLWTGVFGTGALALRFPSAVFSALSVFFIFKMARELYDERTALFSAAFLAVSPYSIYYAQEAKMYSLLWLFGLVSFLYLYRFMQNGRMRDLAVYVMSALCMIYTMYAGFILLAVHNIFFFYFCKKKNIRAWLICQAVIFLFYLPWYPMLLHHIEESGKHLFWITRTGDIDNGARNILPYVSGLQFYADYWINRITFFIYIFLAASAVVAWKNIKGGVNMIVFKKQEALLLLWICFPVLVFFLIDSCLTPIFIIPRYIGFIHMPFIILLSKGISGYNCGISRIKLSFAIFLVLLSINVSNNLFPYYRYNFETGRDNFVKCFEWLEKNADENAPVININMPPRIVEYFDRKNRIKPKVYLSEIKGRGHESVFFLFYYSDKKEAEDSLARLEKRLNMSLSAVFYSSREMDSYAGGAAWLKKPEPVKNGRDQDQRVFHSDRDLIYK